MNPSRRRFIQASAAVILTPGVLMPVVPIVSKPAIHFLLGGELKLSIYTKEPITFVQLYTFVTRQWETEYGR